MNMHSEYYKFENKKEYLSKRIREEYDFLVKQPYDNELHYIINLCGESFFYSAPEVVDSCFNFLKRYIHLDDDFEIKSVNIYGNPIRCYNCDSFGHVQKDCDKIDETV